MRQHQLEAQRERLIDIPTRCIDRVIEDGQTGSRDTWQPWLPSYVALLYGAGIGTVEALSLSRFCYRREYGVIVVPSRPTVLAYQAIDWRARTIPMLPRVRAVVDGYLDAQGGMSETDPLIQDASGKTPTRDRAFRAVKRAMAGVGLAGVDPVRLQDAFVRAVWALDRGLGHGESLIGIQRGQYGLGRRAFALPSLAELGAFLDVAHPWGSAYGRATR